jgi:hypothetical protein
MPTFPKEIFGFVAPKWRAQGFLAAQNLPHFLHISRQV